MPDGFRSAAVACGIRKSGRVDLGAVMSDVPVEWCGTFTRNAAAAAPVEWCRSRLGQTVRGVVVNSGNANACTGRAGYEAVDRVLAGAASAFDCAPNELLVASTGPIGVALPVDQITTALPSLATTLGKSTDEFAEAILTTDTKIKRAQAQAGRATITGVAKGSAMLAPNMATMLAFITTDAALPSGSQGQLSRAVENTFNRISVDECESTNDSVFLLGSGLHEVDEEAFSSALFDVCKSLVEQMARDAEGATRLIRIQVEGAKDDDEAFSFGKAIAGSVLWRAAAHGADANWGRIVSALGSVKHSLDLTQLHVSIGPELVFAKGEPTGSLQAASEAMSADEFTVRCEVGPGRGSAEVLSVDLSPEYVTMNAGGLT